MFRSNWTRFGIAMATAAVGLSNEVASGLCARWALPEYSPWLFAVCGAMGFGFAMSADEEGPDAPRSRAENVLGGALAVELGSFFLVARHAPWTATITAALLVHGMTGILRRRIWIRSRRRPAKLYEGRAAVAWGILDVTFGVLIAWLLIPAGSAFFSPLVNLHRFCD